MDVIIDAAYLIGIGIGLGFMCMIIYVNLWEK